MHIPGIEATSDDACYRAMDWLLTVEPQLARGVFDQVAHLLNLEVDLIFFDTTSTYFETEDPDEPVWRDPNGRRLPDPPATATATSGGGADGGDGGEESVSDGAAAKAGF